MLKRREFRDEKIVILKGRRKATTKMDQASAHEQILVPAVKDLLRQGFSVAETAEMMRVAADVLEGKNADLY
jgi:hypothetical protein